MAVFPAVKYAKPFTESIRTKTLITKFEGYGDEQRKRKMLYPRRDVSLTFENISVSDARQLWQFYLDRGGQYEAFNIFSDVQNTYEGEYVGVGDGSQTVFNCPSKLATSRTFYVAGSEETELTFSSQGGTDGADKVEFTTAPDSAEVITMDFTGYLKYHVRFSQEIMTFDMFYRTLVSTGLQMTGLLNE